MTLTIPPEEGQASWWI